MNKEEKNPAKCPFCGRPAHKESKYCIFHFNKDLNITIFENANFRKTTSNGCANFKGATFEAGAYFTWCTFIGIRTVDTP